MTVRVVATLLLAALPFALAEAVGTAGEQQARGTAVCPHPLALRIEVGTWSLPTSGSPHEFFAAMSSRGGRGPGGLDIYAWATPTSSHLNGVCRRIVQRGVSSAAALRAPLSYRITDSGNSYFVDRRGAITPGSPVFGGRPDLIGQRHASALAFSCNVARRVVVHVHPLARQGGHYLSLRTAAGRKLLALAILKRSGESTFRIARSCRQD